MKRFYLIKIQTKYIPNLFFSAMIFLNKSFLEKLSPQSFKITITNCQNVKEVDNLQLGGKKILSTLMLTQKSKSRILFQFSGSVVSCFSLGLSYYRDRKKKKSKSAKFTIGPNSLALKGWTRWTIH